MILDYPDGPTLSKGSYEKEAGGQSSREGNVIVEPERRDRERERERERTRETDCEVDAITNTFNSEDGRG